MSGSAIRRVIYCLSIGLCLSTSGIESPRVPQTVAVKSPEEFDSLLKNAVEVAVKEWKSANDDTLVYAGAAELISSGFLKRKERFESAKKSQKFGAEGTAAFVGALVRHYLYDIKDFKIAHIPVGAILPGLVSFSKLEGLPAATEYEVTKKDFSDYKPEKFIDRIFKFLWGSPLFPEVRVGEVLISSRPDHIPIILKELILDKKTNQLRENTLTPRYSPRYTSRTFVLTVGPYKVEIIDHKNNLNCSQQVDIVEGQQQVVDCQATPH